MEIIKSGTSIDFLGKRGYAISLSVLLVAASVYIWVARGTGKFGIDFVGGHEFIVELPAQSDRFELASRLEKAGLPEVTVQSFELDSNDVSIRVGLSESYDAKKLREILEKELSDLYASKYSIVATDSIGATIGEEVYRSALIAISLGLVGVLIYIAYRFEFSFALGAVIAMFHDVIVATGAYLFAGHDLNSYALAAALTIVGYSVNDTIVIFDRVREEMRKHPNQDLAAIMNESMNYCLSRTIITSLLTLFSAVALLVFGGGAIQDLSLFLVAGLVSGVYSTIYIAAPVVLWWEGLRAKRHAKAARQGA